MKAFLSFICLFVLTMNSHEQQISPDFKTITINKKIKEFSDQFDLSSPLHSFITLKYISINGKNRLLRSVSTVKDREIFPDSTAEDSQVPANVKNRYLEIKINEVITYKDSVAFVISEDFDEDQQFYYSIRSFYLEAGNWVTSGESTAQNIEDAHQFVADRAELFFQDFHLILKDFYDRFR